MSHTFPRADLGLERGVCAAVPLKFTKIWVFIKKKFFLGGGV